MSDKPSDKPESTNNDYLSESELRQLHQGFARAMTDPSTIPKIMMRFFNSYNRLLKRVEALESVSKKPSPPVSDLSNI